VRDFGIYFLLIGDLRISQFSNAVLSNGMYGFGLLGFLFGKSTVSIQTLFVVALLLYVFRTCLQPAF